MLLRILGPHWKVKTISILHQKFKKTLNIDAENPFSATFVRFAGFQLLPYFLTLFSLVPFFPASFWIRILKKDLNPRSHPSGFATLIFARDAGRVFWGTNRSNSEAKTVPEIKYSLNSFATISPPPPNLKWASWRRLELSNAIMAGSREPVLLRTNRMTLVGHLIRPL